MVGATQVWCTNKDDLSLFHLAATNGYGGKLVCVALFYCIESVVIRSQGYLSSDPAHWLSVAIDTPPDTFSPAFDPPGA